MTKSFQQPILTGAIGISIGLFLTLLLMPRAATGYPTTTVSMGQNPVVSVGGTLSEGGTTSVFTAPADQDLIITDVVFGVTNTYSYYCDGNFQVQLHRGSEHVAQFAVGHPNLDQSQLRNEVISLNSGIRISAGEALDLSFNRAWRDCGDFHTLNYTLSGYYAQP